ncbi:methyl-accepting chemotaxis protein [Paenibacillus campi]|uniref:methyl-accepting chemotaxis protein n=1 Tax=Paenibacillus campi TaxID=3106031 RepID=UPI002AFE047D|nr:methyl-accepting chemotaxis protein [Paenibacillus sp. SGZ-1009]
MLKYRFRSIKTRTMATLIPIVLITLILISLVSYLFSRASLSEQVDQSTIKSLQLITNDINAQLVNHAAFVSAMASVAGTLEGSTAIANYGQIGIDNLKFAPFTYGTGVFFANGAYAPNVKYRSIYAYREGDQLKVTQTYDDPAYDYLNQTWYTDSTAAQGKVAYTEPYYDKTLNLTLITAGQAFYKPNGGALAGVATADLDLSNIENTVRKLDVGNNGSAILFDKNGMVLASGTSLTKQGAQASTVLGADLSANMLQNDTGEGVLHAAVNDKVIYGTIAQTGWKIAVLLPLAEVERPMNQLLLLLSAVGIVGLLIILASIWWSNRDLIREIQTIRKLSGQMAEGDYAHHLQTTRRDEFGQMSEAFNGIMAGTSTIVGTLREEANTIHHSADRLSKGMQQAAAEARFNVEQMEQLRQGAEVQLISTSESTTAMEEMAIGIQRIAESVQQVSEATYGIEAKTEQGNEHIGKVNQQIHIAKGALDEVGEVIQSLNERSEQIGEVIHFIHEISQQTKLLALNASIEAARAGEHGRGFAVVAAEIGKLAESVGTSASRITSQVGEMQQETRNALQGMQEGSLQVGNGLQLLDEIKERFALIRTDIARVADEVQEVSSASEQMSAGSEQISASLTQLANIARTSATYSTEALERSRHQLHSLDELNSSTDSLQEVTVKLNEVIGKFRIRE